VDFGKIEVRERRRNGGENGKKIEENLDKKPNLMLKRPPCFKFIQFLTSAIIIETPCNSLQ
jgi:hypothetical protein